MGKKAKPPHPADVVPCLTTRQQEVLYLLLSDRTTKEIAEQLQIHRSRVSQIKADIMRQFRVRTDLGLARAALRLGIDPDC